MTSVGYVLQRKSKFWSNLERQEFCIMANQLGGSPLNFGKELFCDQCQNILALVCQYSVNVNNRVRTVYCFACKRDCGEVVVVRIFREKYPINTLEVEFQGLEPVCCFKKEHRNPKNNMKMYKRQEVLLDEEDEDMSYSFDSIGLLMYQQDFPTTVIRWSRSDVFVTDTIPISFKDCKCGAKRVLESQILPNSLYYLKQKEDERSLDFGTILIGCCIDNCGKNDERIYDQAIRMSFKDPPKNEDGVYDYSHLLKHKIE